ncbi:MAG: hypothetical protein NT176_20185, partial [Proteobacteria bacterium]|nr:hypothetical protein [Pseudomonadota bacterium]
MLKHLTIYDGIVGRAFEESITFLRQAFHHQWPTWAVALVAGIVVARKPKWSGAAVAVALPMVTIVAGVRFVAPRGGPEWPSASNTL